MEELCELCSDEYCRNTDCKPTGETKMEIKTTQQIMNDSNFNYMYPQASINRCKRMDNRKWVAVDDIEKMVHSFVDISIISGSAGRLILDRLSDKQEKVNKNGKA